jgi:hypothetical protein
MAIPKGGVFEDKVQQGRYGPIFPKSPACYGFTIIAKIIPGREDVFYQYAKNIEKAVGDQPDCLAVLKLHYLRWVLFPIKGETYFMYQAFTWNGLRALGVDEGSLASFPEEFKQGMVARAEMLGDTGENHPDNWVGGLASPDLHAIAILFARDAAERARCLTALRRGSRPIIGAS